MAQIEWNQEAIEDFDEIYLNLMRLDVEYAENFAETLLSIVHTSRDVGL